MYAEVCLRGLCIKPLPSQGSLCTKPLPFYGLRRAHYTLSRLHPTYAMLSALFLVVRRLKLKHPLSKRIEAPLGLVPTLAGPLQVPLVAAVRALCINPPLHLL